MDQCVTIQSDDKNNRSVVRILYKVSNPNVNRVTTEIKKTFRRNISSHDSNKENNLPKEGHEDVSQTDCNQLKATELKDSYVDLILTTILKLERNEPKESGVRREETEEIVSDPPSPAIEPPKENHPKSNSAPALVTAKTSPRPASVAIKVIYYIRL